MFRSRKKNKLYQAERASAAGLSLNGQAFKSGLEATVAQALFDQGIRYAYESVTIPYTEHHTYRPDFLLLKTGVLVETKGLWEADDRAKMKTVKAQYPDIDIRLVFYNSSSRIAKQSKTTYAMWCEKNGFKWANRSIPKEWLTEPKNERSLAAIELLRALPKKLAA